VASSILPFFFWFAYSSNLNIRLNPQVISNGRVALENLLKYGILISPLEWLNNLVHSSPGSWPNLIIVLCSNITILSAFLIEKLLGEDHFKTHNSLKLICFSLFQSKDGSPTLPVQCSIFC